MSWEHSPTFSLLPGFWGRRLKAVRAIVLGQQKHGDKGLRIQLLTHDEGVETLFLKHGVRKGSSAGMWSLGSIVRCERKSIKGRPQLRGVETELMMKRAAVDLDAFHQKYLNVPDLGGFYFGSGQFPVSALRR